MPAGSQADPLPSSLHPSFRLEPGREIKFLAPPGVMDGLKSWLKNYLEPDPHALGPDQQYRVTTLYFDTDALEVFYRRASYGRGKYRIRRYNDEPQVFLERKLRTGSNLIKRRQIWDLDGLAKISGRHEARWFLERIELRRLRPACLVTYQRLARTQRTPQGMVRATLDENIGGRRCHSLCLDPSGPFTPALPGQGVLELKFGSEPPALFKRLVAEFALEPVRFSKYRAAMTTLHDLPSAPMAPRQLLPLC